MGEREVSCYESVENMVVFEGTCCITLYRSITVRQVLSHYVMLWYINVPCLRPKNLDMMRVLRIWSPLRGHVVLHYIEVLHHVKSCHIMSCQVLSHYVMLCHDTSTHLVCVQRTSTWWAFPWCSFSPSHWCHLLSSVAPKCVCSFLWARCGREWVRTRERLTWVHFLAPVVIRSDWCLDRGGRARLGRDRVRIREVRRWEG